MELTQATYSLFGFINYTSGTPASDSSSVDMEQGSVAKGAILI